MDDKTILEIANKFITISNPTVRNLTNYINCSKSTIHNALRGSRLKQLNNELYEKCDKILEKNYKERHIRGGLATKEKYKNKK